MKLRRKTDPKVHYEPGEKPVEMDKMIELLKEHKLRFGRDATASVIKIVGGADRLLNLKPEHRNAVCAFVANELTDDSMGLARVFSEMFDTREGLYTVGLFVQLAHNKGWLTTEDILFLMPNHEIVE